MAPRLHPLMVILLSVAPPLLTAQPQAAVIHVPGDQPTIGDGVSVAADGDTVLVAPGTYSGPGNTAIYLSDKNLSILSEAGPYATIVDGAPYSGQAFRFSIGVTSMTRVCGFTFRHWISGDAGAVWMELASPVFEHCVFEGNLAECQGGAVGAWWGSPQFIECEFVNNEAACEGGGVALIRCTDVRFSRCRFSSNIAGWPGAAVSADGSNVVLEECTFNSNSISWCGGALYASANSPGWASLELIDCTFHDSQGTAIMVGANVPAEIRNTIVAFGTGAAVTCEPSSEVYLSCCDIYGNAGGDWVGCIAEQYGINGNISEDPLFCGAQWGDFTLDAASPCAPEHSGGCGLIGALPVGCGTTAVSENPTPRTRLRLAVTPNPVLHGATFTFEPSAHPVSLEIYDPAGRLVERLWPSGAVTWRPNERAARGVYFARLKGEGGSETVKFVVLR